MRKRSIRAAVDADDYQIVEMASREVGQDASDLEDGIILIHSDIDEGLWENVIRPLKQLERTESVKELTIYLSTEGGTISDALTYCDVLDRITKPTTVILFGEVLSCGLIMACAGYSNDNVKTVCYPSVVGMIHSPYVHRYKDEPVTTKALRELGDILGQREEAIFRYILDHSKITTEKLEEMMEKDYYMDAEEMLRFGIVDEIL